MLSITGCSDTIQTTTNASSGEVVSSELKEKETVLPTLEENFAEIVKTSREFGTDGEKRAFDYLFSQMKSYGYDVVAQPFKMGKASVKNFGNPEFDFFNVSPLNGQVVAESNNLIAEKNYDKNKKTLVFCTHYDTEADSLGAADNGSGTAALLEAAKIMKDYQLNYNLRIIFFSSEEYCIYGSRYYVSELSDEEIENIVGCFNIDMVGTKDFRRPIIRIAPTGTKTITLEDGTQQEQPNVESNWISNEYKRINGEYELLNSIYADDAPFNKKGIPAIYFTTCDLADEQFDTKTMLVKEENADSISFENLQIDVNLIVDFMKNVDISEYTK